MQRLYRKRIVLGVGGGIAAYKSAELVRRLRDQGAEVRVVMTQGGREFITPLTLQALSGHPVHTDLLDPAAEAAMGHIELARWADLVLIAPATADLMARLVQGVANDLLTTLVLATDAQIALAPAMNQAMWRDTATQANAELLRQRGFHLFGPAAGSQACGDVGLGRMLEAEELAQRQGIELELENDLRELHFGAWEGRSAASLMDGHSEALGRFWADPYAFTPPGGEPLSEFEARVLAAQRRLRQRHAGRRVLLVTHGGVIRLLLARARGLPREHLLQVDVGHGALFGLRAGEGDDRWHECREGE